MELSGGGGQVRQVDVKIFFQDSGALNVLQSVLWRGWVAPLVGILYGWRR